MSALAPLVKKRKFAELAPAFQPTYDEGTYTVTVSDGTNNATLTTDNGRWIRVGNMMHAEFDVLVSSVASASGAVRFSLPLARRSGGISSSGVVGYVTHLSAGSMGDNIALRVDSGNDFAYIIVSSAGGAGASIAFTNLNSTGSTTVRGSIVYPVDAQDI